MVLATAVGAALVVVLTTGGEGWRVVVGSGVFRWRDAEVKSSVRERRKNDRQLFYEDAADATVSVDEVETRLGRELMLRVNGKIDASTLGDLSTQVLLAHLPLMMKPESKDVFVFGMGSGITAGTVLGHPIERLTVAENCEPVLRAAKLFEPWNNGVLTNSRVRILREDARTVLKLDAQKYDAIIAEPSNPWTIGVGSVFSREFYQSAANRLKPGGIMAQWFHLYEMNDEIVEMVIRTFATVFPAMEIWESQTGDIIMLGSSQPWKSDREAYQRVFALERPKKDLEGIGLMTPEMLLARQFASQRTAFAVPGEGPIQTDEFPLLEYRAPRAFFVGLTAGRICFFDERTWQSDIAPAQKSSVLAALGTNAVKTVFEHYKSVNPALQDHLKRAWEGKLCSTLERTGGGTWLPCAFGVANCAPMKPPPGISTNEVGRRLFEAELTLDSATDPAVEARALAEIKKVLETTVNYKTDAGWSAVYYSSLVVKRYLRRGEGQAARQVLLRGLQLEPSSPFLPYLGRVLIREGILQPSDLPGPEQKSQPPPKPKDLRSPGCVRFDAFVCGRG